MLNIVSELIVTMKPWGQRFIATIVQKVTVSAAWCADALSASHHLSNQGQAQDFCSLGPVTHEAFKILKQPYIMNGI